MTRRWMEVEWRRSLGPEETEDAVVWQRREVPWDNEGIDLCECDGIEEGVSYDVRVRGASEDAVPSDWDTRYSIRADIGTELPPPAPTGLRLEGGCLLWDFPRREDLAGFEVRHVEGENPDPSLWGLGVSLTPSLVAGPPVATCAVPGGRRVVMVKAVLASGIESAEAGVLSVFVGDFDASEPSAIAETDLAADSWASTTRLLGELDGPAIVGSELGEDVFWFEGTVEFWGLDDSAPWWDVNEAAPFWTNDAADSRPFWERGDSEQFWDPYFADLLWEGRLDLSTLDEGPENVLALAPEPVTSTRYWRAEYREESSAFWNRGDDAMPWWTTDGADFWATVVEDWKPWTGRLPGLHAEAIELRLWAPGGRRRPRFEGLVARTSGPIGEERVSGVTLPAGGGRLSAVAGKFRQIVEVLPSLRAGALGVFPMVALGDLDAERGPLILAATPGGAAATATLDFLVRGRR